MTGCTAALLAALCALPALAPAAAADRDAPLAGTAQRIESDRGRGTTVFEGDVIVTQGSTVIHAARIDVLEGADGRYAGHAVGSAAAPIEFSRALERPGQRLAARAGAVEFDGRSNCVRLSHDAQARVLDNGLAIHSLSGEQIEYHGAEGRLVAIGAAGSLANPSGQARALLVPMAGRGRSEANDAAPPSLRSSNSLAPRSPP